MLTEIYKWILKCTSQPGEKGEYSGGYLQDRVRKAALALCSQTEDRLLEIGCGEGLFLAQIVAQNRELQVWGIDNNEARLKSAALRLPNANLSHQDARGLSFAEGYFDTIVCINVLFNLESIDQLKQTLKEMKRVCRKDGRLIFDFRNSLNPLLSIKYRLAKYYDNTLKGLPLKTYTFKEIEFVLKALGLTAAKKKFIGFGLGFFAAAIVVEVKNRW